MGSDGRPDATAHARGGATATRNARPRGRPVPPRAGAAAPPRRLPGALGPPRPLCCRRHHGTCGHALLRRPCRFPPRSRRFPLPPLRSRRFPLPPLRSRAPARASLRQHPRRRRRGAHARLSRAGPGPRSACCADSGRAGLGARGSAAAVLKRGGFVRSESFPGAEGNLEEGWGRTVYRSMW